MSSQAAASEITREDVRSLLKNMHEDPSLSKEKEQLALLEHLADEKFNGRPCNGNTVMDFCVTFITDNLADRRALDQGAYEAGRRAARDSKPPSPLPGMSVRAYEAGVAMGKEETAAQGQFEHHRGKELFERLRNTLNLYFDETRLSALPAENQPVLTITLPNYEPIFTRRSSLSTIVQLPASPDSVQPVSAAIDNRVPALLVTTPVALAPAQEHAKQRLTGRFLAQALEDATAESNALDSVTALVVEFLTALAAALGRDPDLADIALLTSVAKIARCGIKNFYTHQNDAMRVTAQQTLSAMIEVRPQLADVALMASVGETTADKNVHVAIAAQQTLVVIIEQRPELANAPITAIVAKTATWMGRCEEMRKAAQHTLGKIVEGQPELGVSALDIAQSFISEAAEDIRAAAQKTIRVIVERQPNLASAALTASVARIAVTDESWRVRDDAQKTVQVIVEKRPELGVSALDIAQSLVCEAAEDVRAAAQTTIGVILEKRPELVDLTLLDKIAQAALGDESLGIRREALKTLQVIVKRRPELVNAMLIARIVESDQMELFVEELVEAIVKHRPDLSDFNLSAYIAKSVLKAGAGHSWRSAGMIAENRPDLAKVVLGIMNTAVADSDWNVRTAALSMLAIIGEEQPGLADAALIANVTRIAHTDEAAAVRRQAMRTIGTIAGNRPDLVQPKGNEALAHLTEVLQAIAKRGDRPTKGG